MSKCIAHLSQDSTDPRSLPPTLVSKGTVPLAVMVSPKLQGQTTGTPAWLGCRCQEREATCGCPRPQNDSHLDRPAFSHENSTHSCLWFCGQGQVLSLICISKMTSKIVSVSDCLGIFHFITVPVNFKKKAGCLHTGVSEMLWGRLVPLLGQARASGVQPDIRITLAKGEAKEEDKHGKK